MTKFAETYADLCKLSVIDQESLLDDGLLVAETLSAVLYLLAAETVTWKWTKREMCSALRALSERLRDVASECDRIATGYPDQKQA